MPHLSTQEVLLQAKASTEEARKAIGSERKVIKHYQNAKNTLAKVDVTRTNSKDLGEVIAAFENLATVLDLSGELPKEKAAKCRKRACALRQELNERMRIHAAVIAPSLMGPGFSPTIAQGVTHWSFSASTGSTSPSTTFFASSTVVATNPAFTHRQLPPPFSPSTISISASATISGCPSLFTKNVNPKPNIYPLPDPGELLRSTQQLSYCLALLHPSVQEDQLSSEALKWRCETLKDMDEKDRLETLAAHVLEVFTADIRKDAAAVAEVVQISPVLNSDDSRFLIKTFIDTVNKSEILDLHSLDGMAKVIQGAAPGSIDSDDLVTILRCLHVRLRPTHSTGHQYHLLLAASRVLDAMVISHIGDVDRINLHEPLTDFLRESESSKDPYLAFQAKYATQALLYVSDDDNIWHAGFRRVWLVLKIGAGLAKVLDPTELKDTLESIEQLYDIGKGATRMLKIALKAHRVGEGYTFTKREGLKFKRAWYRSVRMAEWLISTGRLVQFKAVVVSSKCRHQLMFQWGICQLLGQFIADTQWSLEAHQEAVELLGALYKDTTIWDRQNAVDQVIFDVLTNIASSNDAHSEAAKLLEEIRKVNPTIKPIADPLSPLWNTIKYADPAGHSIPSIRLLKVVQDRRRRHAKLENLPDVRRVATLSDIQSGLKTYHEPTLYILRVSGEKLDLGSCFVNLAIVEAPEHRQKEKENLKTQATTFLRMPSGEGVRNTNTDSLIPLDQLFNKRKLRDGKEGMPKSILVQGRAGIGKSTLCKKLVHAHQNGLWRDRFEIVLWIPLRHLRGLKSRTLDGLFIERVFVSQGLSQEQSALASALVTYAQQGKVLFIFDGLDEIVAEAGGDESNTFRTFLKMLLRQQHVIITSRPSGVDIGLLPKIDLELETIGFSPQNVKDFVVKVLDPDPARTVQEFIQRTPLIQGLANTPVQLDVICFSWNSLPTEDLAVTMTGLYRLMVRKLWCKDALRLNKTDGGIPLTERQIHDYEPEEIDDLMATELQYLGYLAFKGMINHHQIEFEEKDLRSTFRDLKSFAANNQQLSPAHLVEVIKMTSFLHSADSDMDPKKGSVRQAWHFLHLTFQEYFAATWIVRHFRPRKPCSSSGMMTTEEMTAFVHQHKYNPQYEIVWSMVAGLLDGNPLDKFFELLQGEPRDLIGGRHQQILVSCLHEARARLDPLVVASYDSELARWLQLEICTRDDNFSGSILGSHLSFPENLLVEAISVGHSNKASFIRTLGSRSVLSQSALQSLVIALKDDDRDVRMSAASALRNQSSLTESAVQSLIATLKDNDNNVRSSAASTLGNQPSLPESAVQSLIATLKNDNKNVRSSAASALGMQCSLPESAIQPLIATLKDDNKNVRSSTASALGNQPSLPESAIQSLIATLKDDNWSVRSSAAFALGKQSSLPESAIQSLFATLKDDDINVRSSAAFALGKQSSLPESVVQSLISALKDDDENFRSSAASALGMQSSLPEPVILSLTATLKDDDGNARSSAAFALGNQLSLPESAIQSLIATLKDDEWLVRSSAASALGRQSLLPESAVQSLFATLKDDDINVRSSAVSALGWRASLPESAIQSLFATLKDDDINVRSSAVSALGWQSSLPESVVQSLISALKDDDENFRYSAASALGSQSLLPESAIQSLIAALKDDNWIVRFSAVSALGNQSPLPDSAIQSLITALKDEDSYVRMSAASALGKQSSLPELAIQSLTATLKDEDSDVKSSASSALGKQPSLSESAIRSLIAALEDGSGMVTSPILGALESHSPSVFSALLFLSEDEIDRLFKYHLLLYSLGHVISLQVYDNGLHCCTEQGALKVQISPSGSSRLDTISAVFKVAQQKALDFSNST
ncbi:bilin biosynthesis protein [Entomortierella parvispora]|uniref:Bilin biosynthesis protein n=1 Tax=Entomortierella parvispora TaxID=205924 RepID=A0A9P3H0Z7_9FUNG|nr:bilin biosynthesis protein [Entomortierella parvispora]